MAGLFRDLSEEDQKEFRQWARDNYSPGANISGVWHPVVQDECRKMNEETLGDPDYITNLAKSAGIDSAVLKD